MARRLSMAAMRLFAVIGVAAPAQARWLQATTPHFVVRADLDERELRTEATRLEQFHRLLVALLRIDDGTPAPRLDVYLVAHAADLIKVDPSLARLNGTVSGYYHAGPGGTIAYGVWDSAFREKSRHILYHEYVHHLMARGGGRVLPLSFSEESPSILARPS